MSKVFEGEEWRYAKAPAQTGMTRLAAQRMLNDWFVLKKITRDQWSKVTDFLSEPAREDYESALKTIPHYPFMP